MEESLKDKIRAALFEAAGANAHVELEDISPDRIGGFVLSDSFARLSPTQRQDCIWASLDHRLSPFERTRVVFIVTDTPDEYEAVRRAAG